jgi:hypothetical protein
MKIHHLGIVIDNVSDALIALDKSVDDISERVTDHEQNNNLYFIHIPANNLWIELVEPLNENSTVATFLKKNGMAFHHIGLQTTNLAQITNRYGSKKGAFLLGSYNIFVKSFGGKLTTRFVFINGLLLEYVQVD